MGLFSKKSPCPICGGKISWFLPQKMEDEYICDSCYNKIDMEDEKKKSLTMQSFREYLAFYDQNEILKSQFVISEKIDFGIWDTKIIFDLQNKLFCMSKNPDKTVFESKHLKSFTIKEDNELLFEGSLDGIYRYESTAIERATKMAPQIEQFRMNKQMAKMMDKLDDGKVNGTAPMQFFNMEEPFQMFNVELHLDHPYWTVIKCDMDGPRFDNHSPNINDYIHSYQNSIEQIEKLVASLKMVAFPEVGEQFIGISSLWGQPIRTMNSPAMDAIEEIKKYKALMEEGIISQEEFEAKKRRLLGI